MFSIPLTPLFIFSLFHVNHLLVQFLNIPSYSCSSNESSSASPEMTDMRIFRSAINAFNAGAHNAHKFWRAVNNGSLTMRTVNNLNTTIYYCRAFHDQFNWSSNPTYTVSGSSTLDVISAMRGDPVTFVTTVGLLNSREELLAVAKLSQPVKNSHSIENIFAVKIDG